MSEHKSCRSEAEKEEEVGSLSERTEEIERRAEN
jgi:hypothetical protein